MWDRKISEATLKRMFENPSDPQYMKIVALLLSRKNVPREVFGDYINPLDFCRKWNRVKREMRKDSWSNPRIEFWQAIYEKLLEKYDRRGIKVFEKGKIVAPCDELCKEVGAKIKTTRQQKGMTQKDLAKRLNVSQQLISRIETGKENMSIITLKKIVAALGLTISMEIE